MKIIPEIYRAIGMGLDRMRRSQICFMEIYPLRYAQMYCEAHTFSHALEEEFDADWYRAREGRWAFTEHVIQRVKSLPALSGREQEIRDTLAWMVVNRMIGSTTDTMMVWNLS